MTFATGFFLGALSGALLIAVLWLATIKGVES
jgi:hypothetical protein